MTHDAIGSPRSTRISLGRRPRVGETDRATEAELFRSCLRGDCDLVQPRVRGVPPPFASFWRCPREGSSARCCWCCLFRAQQVSVFTIQYKTSRRRTFNHKEKVNSVGVTAAQAEKSDERTFKHIMTATYSLHTYIHTRLRQLSLTAQ